MTKAVSIPDGSLVEVSIPSRAVSREGRAVSIPAALGRALKNSDLRPDHVGVDRSALYDGGSPLEKPCRGPKAKIGLARFRLLKPVSIIIHPI